MVCVLTQIFIKQQTPFSEGVFKTKTMCKIKDIQSQINAQEARINQFKSSELFSEEKNVKILNQMQSHLEKLQLDIAKEIEVTNPEQVK
ncbi:MAG: hypothetical protein ACI8WA_000055 [Polaribacter sp.]|jgi:hypothetical protein